MARLEKSPGRRPRCAATTRESILLAARQCFLAESYDSVGMREIARMAAVDVALVSRYFGSKEELFRHVLRSGESKFQVEAAAADLPAYMASLIESEDGAPQAQHIGRILIMLRSASSPTASEIVRDAVRNDVLEPLARVIGGERAEIKAGALLAILLGSTILKTVLHVEPYREENRQAVRERLTRLFETALAD